MNSKTIHFNQKDFSSMLIVDKQRPKTLVSMDYHKNISENLIKMVSSKITPFIL